MNWSDFLGHLWVTVNDWWPRLATWGLVLGTAWGIIVGIKTGVVGTFLKNSVAGKEQDRIDSNLLATMRKMIDLEKEHHQAEVALVRTQVAEALAEKDLELAKLRNEVAELRALLEKVAHGELTEFDRRGGIQRPGSSADRAVPAGPGPPPGPRPGPGGGGPDHGV